MKTLVIKPTLKCTCDCMTCVYNSKRFDRKNYVDEMTINDWKNVILDASDLGAKRLHISGGEPTLVPDLIDYVKFAKQKGFVVNLNTNGRFITKEGAKKLVDAGLDSVTVSLYSSDRKEHDRLRGTKDSWKYAKDAIRHFQYARSEAPLFEIKSMTVLTSRNYKQFFDLMKLNYSLGADCFYISYLEGDFDGSNRMSQDDIKDFRENIIPKVLDFSKKISLPVRSKFRQAVKSLFSDDFLSPIEWESGMYGVDRKRECTVPSDMAIVLSNGDVVPCYMIEYTRDKIVGNVMKHKFSEVWSSKKHKEFVKDKCEYCKECPMHLHTWIPLRLSRLFIKEHFFGRKVLDLLLIVFKRIIGDRNV